MGCLKLTYREENPTLKVVKGLFSNEEKSCIDPIQGWLKNVNSESLIASRDMGKDGNQTAGNSNKNFALDAFGFSLGYFNGDYEAISQPSTVNNPLADKTGSDLNNNTTNLYNGNISSMVTTITTPVTFSPEPSFETLAQSNAYTYDRLNRLRESKSFANLDYSTNQWMNSGNPYDGRYHNQFTYNANGGMLTAMAKNAMGEIIDNQTYHRPTTTNGRYVNNRTYAITDAATQTSGEDLLDQQAFDNTVLSNNNYGFTEIGERNKDNLAETELITWNVYGKKTAVKRINGSSKNNVKFDYDATNNRIAKHVYTSDDIWINTEYYVRDAQGNLMATYNLKASSGSGLSYELTERHIYGSSSIGIVTTPVEMIGANTPTDTYPHVIGDKRFNGSNHLQNVLSVFTDKKLPLDTDNNGIIDGYLPDVIAANDYAPFGGRLTERTFNKELYPNSFNGKREAAELDGEQDYGERDYNPKEREFDKIDPLTGNYPWWTPYQFAGDNPVRYIDLDGKEKDDPQGGDGGGEDPNFDDFMKELDKAYPDFTPSLDNPDNPTSTPNPNSQPNIPNSQDDPLEEEFGEEFKNKIANPLETGVVTNFVDKNLSDKEVQKQIVEAQFDIILNSNKAADRVAVVESATIAIETTTSIETKTGEQQKSVHQTQPINFRNPNKGIPSNNAEMTINPGVKKVITAPFTENKVFKIAVRVVLVPIN